MAGMTRVMVAAAAAVGLLVAGCGGSSDDDGQEVTEGPSLGTLAFWDELEESGTLDAACDLGSPAVMVATLVDNDIADLETARERAEHGVVLFGWQVSGG